MKKISIALLIASAAMLLSACGGQSAYCPEVAYYDAVWAEIEIKPKTETEIDFPEDIAHKTLYPIAVTVMINENLVTFKAYEIFGKLFFSLEDLSLALERTQARFRHRDTDTWVSHTAEYIASKAIDERMYVTLWNLAPIIGLEIDHLPDYGMIAICTNEPYIGKSERKAIEDFLIRNYSQIFTFEQVWEDFREYFGEYFGSWFASRFTLFDINGGTPGITIRFDDAGSGYYRTYKFLNGEYQFVDSMPHWWMQHDDHGRLVWLYLSFENNIREYVTLVNGEIQPVEIDDEETLTRAARSLIALGYEAADSINQQLWPSLKTLPNGVITDARLCDDAINLILSFFDDMDSDWFVSEIRKSPNSEGLVRVDMAHDTFTWTGRYWLEICNNGDGREILGYVEGFWLWSRDWMMQQCEEHE